jgi:hypothetical protein
MFSTGRAYASAKRSLVKALSFGYVDAWDLSRIAHTSTIDSPSCNLCQNPT